MKYCILCTTSFVEATRGWCQGHDKKCSCKRGSPTFAWGRWKDGGLVDNFSSLLLEMSWLIRLVQIKYLSKYWPLLFPQVWRINGSAKTPLPREDIGKFYSGDCYIVLYTYHSGDRKEDYFLCCWFGKDSIEVNYIVLVCVWNFFKQWLYTVLVIYSAESCILKPFLVL